MRWRYVIWRRSHGRRSAPTPWVSLAGWLAARIAGVPPACSPCWPWRHRERSSPTWRSPTPCPGRWSAGWWPGGRDGRHAPVRPGWRRARPGEPGQTGDAGGHRRGGRRDRARLVAVADRAHRVPSGSTLVARAADRPRGGPGDAPPRLAADRRSAVLDVGVGALLAGGPGIRHDTPRAARGPGAPLRRDGGPLVPRARRRALVGPGGGHGSPWSVWPAWVRAWRRSSSCLRCGARTHGANRRCQTATSEAPNRFQGELAILRNSSDLQSKVLFEPFENLLTSFNITGGSQTDPDNVLSPGDGREEGIERDNTINLGGGQEKSCRNAPLDLFWKVTTNILSFLEHGNEGPVFPLVFGNNLIDLLPFVR